MRPTTDVGVDRLSARILSIFTIIDIGYFQNRFADNTYIYIYIYIYIFFYANKHTILQVTLFIGE